MLHRFTLFRFFSGSSRGAVYGGKVINPSDVVLLWPILPPSSAFSNFIIVRAIRGSCLKTQFIASFGVNLIQLFQKNKKNTGSLVCSYISDIKVIFMGSLIDD